MLRGAVERHEKENTLPKSSSQNFFSSSPPTLSSQKQSPANSSVRNQGSKDPLKPAPSSVLNGTSSFRPPQHTTAGVKRTSSGLAKVFQPSFDDGPGSLQSPILVDDGVSRTKGITQVPPSGLFDEDDFDSDVDLDIEEPASKRFVGYPKLPRQSNAAAPAKPIKYPTLPRPSNGPVELPKTRTPADPGYASMEPSANVHTPRSSIPFQWSSSPFEHSEPMLPPPTLKQFMYEQPDTEQLSSQIGPHGPKASQRRRLPWGPGGSEQTNQEHARDSFVSSATTKAKARSGADSTPAAKDDKKGMYLWNTTASAVKEQQKRHREEARKANVKANDEIEDNVGKVKTARSRPVRVFLSEEQQHVLDLVAEKKKSVFFTGSAGTGKSVLMREIIASFRKKYVREPDRIAVTASTGLAACNVGGVTLHSFAGIGLGKEDVPELVRKIKRNQKAKHRWMRTKVLIIDEVSMVDADLFDKLEGIARQLRNNGRPFGGIQLVITGDFFQLPPVPDSGRVAKFAFDAGTWNTTIEHTIGLSHVFRQKDPIFAGMLNEMREGRLSESSIKAFRSLSRDLKFEDAIDATELFPTRAEVDRANNNRLGMLQGNPVVFEARDGGAIVDLAQRSKLLQNCMAPELITLKKGSQVMLIKNVDETLVNGSLGRVVGFMSEQEFDRYHESDVAREQSRSGAVTDEGAALEEKAKIRAVTGISTSRMYPVVRFTIADGTTRDLLCQPESWKVELPNGEVQASRTQIPLILAWALSIHKAQGQTLERVKVDLGKVFEKGQAYVALSRATSMAGLQVLRFDPKKVNAHERVRTFYSNLSTVELSENYQDREKVHRAGISASEYEKRFVNDG